LLDAMLQAGEHFSRHVGQIIFITKLRRGIDLKFYNLAYAGFLSSTGDLHGVSPCLVICESVFNPLGICSI
jgi:hypothetical protein